MTVGRASGVDSYQESCDYRSRKAIVKGSAWALKCRLQMENWCSAISTKQEFLKRAAKLLCPQTWSLWKDLWPCHVWLKHSTSEGPYWTSPSRSQKSFSWLILTQSQTWQKKKKKKWSLTSGKLRMIVPRWPQTFQPEPCTLLPNRFYVVRIWGHCTFYKSCNHIYNSQSSHNPPHWKSTWKKLFLTQLLKIWS